MDAEDVDVAVVVDAAVVVGSVVVAFAGGFFCCNRGCEAAGQFPLVKLKLSPPYNKSKAS